MERKLSTAPLPHKRNNTRGIIFDHRKESINLPTFFHHDLLTEDIIINYLWLCDPTQRNSTSICYYMV